MKSTHPIYRTLRKQSGFTLLEIMIVVAIIALLAGLAINQIQGQIQIAREARTKADIQTLKTQIVAYEASNGFPPSTEQGLKALVQQPSGSPVPKSWRQLLPAVPVDPWGMEYHYVCPGKNGADFDITSSGQDRQLGTADDISSASK